jgi:hypothetical protein
VPRKPCKFTEADLRRALRAAQKEGLPVRIEIAPNDGRMAIILVTAATVVKGATGPNEWDGVQ